MEQGFDFSQLKWIIIFAVFVMYKFFTAKPKVDPVDSSEDGGVDTAEQTMKRFEELFGEPTEVAEKRGSNTESEASATTQKRSARRGATPAAVQSSRSVALENKIAQSEILTTQIEDNIGKSGSVIEEEFDLRQAVIMSEILNRKYDE